MSAVQALVDLIGEVPSGYEPIAYVLASLFFLYIVVTGFSLLATIMRR